MRDERYIDELIRDAVANLPADFLDQLRAEAQAACAEAQRKFGPARSGPCGMTTEQKTERARNAWAARWGTRQSMPPAVRLA